MVLLVLPAGTATSVGAVMTGALSFTSPNCTVIDTGDEDRRVPEVSRANT
jgi:hypothetical protein